MTEIDAALQSQDQQHRGHPRQAHATYQLGDTDAAIPNRPLPDSRGGRRSSEDRDRRVRGLRGTEPGSRLYAAWQEVGDPTKFVHLFIFEDEAAHRAYGSSEAVAKFEEVYRPELIASPVIFTDYHLVAANKP
jgi:quinol monooxygenase YgiN